MPQPTRSITILDPADDSLVGRLDLATSAEVEAAVGAAVKAAPEWARTAPAERSALVLAIADRIAGAAAGLATLTTREMGKPLADARGGVDAGVSTLRQYAELGPLHRGRALQGSWDATDLMVPARAASSPPSPRGTTRSPYHAASSARPWSPGTRWCSSPRSAPRTPGWSSPG